jgi:hypothetical protein
MSEWTPVRVVEWGRKHGEHIAKLFEEIIDRRKSTRNKASVHVFRIRVNL